MGQIRVADLPTLENVDEESFVIIEKPEFGDGTYKSTVKDLQKAITVTANVTHQGHETVIYIKDIEGETTETIVTPTATVTDNGDNTVTISFTDTDGTTEARIVSSVVMDDEPTEGSPNFVSSGVVYDVTKSLDDRETESEGKIADAESRISAAEERIAVLEQKIARLEERATKLEAASERSLMVEDSYRLPDPYSTDGERYDSLADAIVAASASQSPVTLFSDADADGTQVASGSKLTLDLNGYELHVTGPGTGSPGTETLGMQLLKGSDIVIKNGRLNFINDKLKMGIQNYSNLTLDNVEVIGGPTIQYSVSNNFGNVVFKNGTHIVAAEGQVAFDCWYGMSPVYDAGVNIKIEDESVVIDGKVEFGKASRASASDFAEHASITCPATYGLIVDILNPPCDWINNGDGTRTLRYSG